MPNSLVDTQQKLVTLVYYVQVPDYHRLTDDLSLAFWQEIQHDEIAWLNSQGYSAQIRRDLDPDPVFAFMYTVPESIATWITIKWPNNTLKVDY